MGPEGGLNAASFAKGCLCWTHRYFALRSAGQGERATSAALGRGNVACTREAQIATKERGIFPGRERFAAERMRKFFMRL